MPGRLVKPPEGQPNRRAKQTRHAADDVPVGHCDSDARVPVPVQVKTALTLEDADEPVQVAVRQTKGHLRTPPDGNTAGTAGLDGNVQRVTDHCRPDLTLPLKDATQREEVPEHRLVAPDRAKLPSLRSDVQDE